MQNKILCKLYLELSIWSCNFETLILNMIGIEFNKPMATAFIDCAPSYLYIVA